MCSDPVQEMSDPCVDPRLVLLPTLVSPTHHTINNISVVLHTSQWSSRVALKQKALIKCTANNLS